jgi:hypothetical protein
MGDAPPPRIQIERLYRRLPAHVDRVHRVVRRMGVDLCLTFDGSKEERTVVREEGFVGLEKEKRISA